MLTELARALDATGRLVPEVAETPGALASPTPCAAWDLRALLAHMVGQNDGFAAAVASGDAPGDAYAPADLADADVHREWDRSARSVLAAFRAADLAAPVRLAEFPAFDPVPGRMVLRMVLLDTVVHCWDVAASLGRAYRPDDDLVDLTLTFAREIAARGGAEPSFAPPLAAPADGHRRDSWSQALALLGRAADDEGRWSRASR